MNDIEFIEAANETSRYITNYRNNIRDKRVIPNVEPGFIRKLLPNSPPDSPENFQDIMKDVENVITPGMTHWQSPHFHAFFPAGSSYPSIVADMLIDNFGCIGVSWIASPVSTELEILMTDWLAQLLHLPKHFLSNAGGNGGGSIMGSASEALLMAMCSAREKTLNKLRQNGDTNKECFGKFVAYTSEQANCSVMRVAMLAGVKIRMVESDDPFRMTATSLRNTILDDIKTGLQPFFIIATLGTTACCSFDNLRSIAEVAAEFGLWTHVDAAYAASAFICEEFRYLLDGVELVDSFVFNPHKWLHIHLECSVMWLKNKTDIEDAFEAESVYIRHKNPENLPMLRKWQIGLGRRFRSLKIWFVLRSYGKTGLQKYIRKHVSLAKEFEKFVRSDERFEIIGEVILGLVCFRLKGSNSLNEKLVEMINGAGLIYMVLGMIRDTIFLRYAVCSERTESSDVEISWNEVKKHADELLKQPNGNHTKEMKKTYYLKSVAFKS